MSLSVKEACALLGIAPRTMYSLAAPAGPLPCYRVGRRVIFEREDVLEYKAKCRSTVIRQAVASSLSSAVVSTGAASALRKSFLALGIKPKPTNSIAKSRDGSTH
ncbi:MAG: helix-turn-helix domain-containing protein [Janthinobacterium lividum]